jgi:GxxExxY protein
MALELGKQNMAVKEEQPLNVYYEKAVVGEFFVDLFVENEIIVELKSVENLNKAHEVQLVNYLNGMKKDIGLLINFGPTGVEVKRKYRKNIEQDQ